MLHSRIPRRGPGASRESKAVPLGGCSLLPRVHAAAHHAHERPSVRARAGGSGGSRDASPAARRGSTRRSFRASSMDLALTQPVSVLDVDQELWQVRC